MSAVTHLQIQGYAYLNAIVVCYQNSARTSRANYFLTAPRQLLHTYRFFICLQNL